MLDITKVYKTKHVDAESRSQLLEVLDAVYKFSQSKICSQEKIETSFYSRVIIF
jgi:hypothetical protein